MEKNEIVVERALFRGLVSEIGRVQVLVEARARDTGSAEDAELNLWMRTLVRQAEILLERSR